MADKNAFRVLAYVAVGHSLSHAFLLFYPTVVLALGDEFQMTYAELLPLSLGAFIMYGLGALPAGWLGDRWSAKGMLVLMFIGMGGGAIITGAATGPIGIIVGLSIIGLFGSIYHPVGIATVVRYATNRGKALGANGIFGGLGMASAAVVAGALTEWVSWRAAFFVPGGVSILVGLLFMWHVPRFKEAGSGKSAAENDGAGVKQIIPVLAILIGASICIGTVYQATSIAMPKLLSTRVEFAAESVFITGLLVSMIYVVGAFGQYFGGSLADRFNLKILFISGFALQVPFLILMAVTGGTMLLPLALLAVLFSLGIQPVSDSLLAHSVPARWHATAYGARFVASLGVSAAAVPLIASIYKSTGEFFWLFAILAALAIVATLLAVFLPYKVSFSEEAAPVGEAVNGKGVNGVSQQSAD
jgi:MFS transporter, FSR family, fosmidomycin resistance protein